VTGYGLRCWIRLRCMLNGYANCCIVSVELFCRFFFVQFSVPFVCVQVQVL